jgi:hypothetical protein
VTIKAERARISARNIRKLAVKPVGESFFLMGTGFL